MNNNEKMTEPSDVSSRNIKDLLKKYSTYSKDEDDGLVFNGTTSMKKNVDVLEEPMSLRFETSSHTIGGINLPPTPSPTNFLSSSHSSASTVSNPSSNSSLSMSCMFKVDNKPPLPFSNGVTPRNRNTMKSDKYKVCHRKIYSTCANFKSNFLKNELQFNNAPRFLHQMA